VRKDEALYSFLAGAPGVAALAGDRIYPRLPGGVTLPAIRYLLGISTAPTYSHDGDGALDEDRVQLDVYAGTYEEAHDLAGQVHAALSGRVSHVGSARLGPAFRTMHRAEYEDALNRWRVLLEYLISFGGCD
jgi:hypothetical protein